MDTRPSYEKYQIKINPLTQYQTEEIGKGEFATVYKGIRKGQDDKAPDEIVALKVMNPDSQSSDNCLNEANIMAELAEAPNIVALTGFFFDDSMDRFGFGYQFIIVMDFFEHGSLTKNLSHLDFGQKIKVMRDVMKAIDYIHDKDYLHNDLKPDNVLLAKNEARLGDFGLACKVKESRTSRGTPFFMAPEVLAYGTKMTLYEKSTLVIAIEKEEQKRDGIKCTPNTKASDIFGCGMLFFSLVANTNAPYNKYNFKGTDHLGYSLYIKGLREDIPEECDEKLKPIIEMTWAPRSEKRPTAQALLSKIEDNYSEPLKISKNYNGCFFEPRTIRLSCLFTSKEARKPIVTNIALTEFNSCNNFSDLNHLIMRLFSGKKDFQRYELQFILHSGIRYAELSELKSKLKIGDTLMPMFYTPDCAPAPAVRRLG